MAKSPKLVLAFTGLGLASTSQALFAAIVTLQGATVTFSYDTTLVDPAYGNLFVATDSTGNLTDTILATPNGYRAESNGGIGINSGVEQDLFSASGLVQVTANTGYTLQAVNVRERGVYNMNAGNTAVDISGTLRVYDWNGSATEASSTMAVAGDLTLRDGVNHSWQGTAGFDLSNATWDGINNVGLELIDSLTAFSSAGTSELAWIEKTTIGGGFEVAVITAPVIPVPPALWLFGSGLVGLFSVLRRRQNS